MRWAAHHECSGRGDGGAQPVSPCTLTPCVNQRWVMVSGCFSVSISGCTCVCPPATHPDCSNLPTLCDVPCRGLCHHSLHHNRVWYLWLYMCFTFVAFVDFPLTSRHSAQYQPPNCCPLLCTFLTNVLFLLGLPQTRTRCVPHHASSMLAPCAPLLLHPNPRAGVCHNRPSGDEGPESRSVATS